MQNNVEIIQINISGEDKPGMTSSLTEILARYDAFILDIGQANIHQSLTLGILFKTTSDKSGNIMKELLFKASELGVMIRFTPISEQNYDNWVGRQGKNRYIITLLGRTVTARHIAEVTRVVAQHGLNIDAIKRLTGRIPLFHFDMYRLGSSDELFDIGWEDYLARGGVCAVEWSENVEDALRDAIHITIEKDPLEPDTRRITIEGGSRFEAAGI